MALGVADGLVCSPAVVVFCYGPDYKSSVQYVRRRVPGSNHGGAFR